MKKKKVITEDKWIHGSDQDQVAKRTDRTVSTHKTKSVGMLISFVTTSRYTLYKIYGYMSSLLTYCLEFICGRMVYMQACGHQVCMCYKRETWKCSKPADIDKNRSFEAVR